MASDKYSYKSIIHHPSKGYELHEKEMRIPKIIQNDNSWEMITGMKYYGEKEDTSISDAMFKSGTDRIRVDGQGS